MWTWKQQLEYTWEIVQKLVQGAEEDPLAQSWLSVQGAGQVGFPDEIISQLSHQRNEIQIRQGAEEYVSSKKNIKILECKRETGMQEESSSEILSWLQNGGLQ